MNRLNIKLLAFNAVVIAFIGVAFLSNWIGPILSQDVTHITWLILALAATGVSFTFLKSIGFIRELREKYGHGADPNQDQESDLIRANASLSIISMLSYAMIMLGIVGTVIGLILALHTITPENISDASAMFGLVATILHGISIKLSTTLFGILGNLWLRANLYFLEKEVQDIVTWADDQSLR